MNYGKKLDPFNIFFYNRIYMADTPKTGETSVKSKPTNKSDTELTLDALQNCLADQDLIVSETYPFIILFILFYITTSRAYFLTSEAKKIPCQENIRRGEYDDFISGFVYWIISFCILIFIKFNGINFINKFVIPTTKSDFDTIEIGGSKKTVEILTSLGRAKYVGQTLLTGFTSVLNICFVFILLLTLYHIIDKTVNLIECKSEVCTKYNLCEKYGEPSKARYYKSDGTCYDSNFNNIEETDPNNNSKPKFTESERSPSTGDRNDPDKPRLYSDFYPRWIGAVIQTNTSFNGLFPILTIIACTLLYIFGWTTNWVKYLIYLIIFVYLVTNFSIMVHGLRMDKGLEDNIIKNISLRACDATCETNEDCEGNSLCKAMGYTGCDDKKCSKQDNQ